MKGKKRAGFEEYQPALFFGLVALDVFLAIYCLWLLAKGA